MVFVTAQSVMPSTLLTKDNDFYSFQNPKDGYYDVCILVNEMYKTLIIAIKKSEMKKPLTIGDYNSISHVVRRNVMTG